MDGIWNNDNNDDNYYNPEDWNSKYPQVNEAFIDEAMRGAYDFLMTPKYVGLRALGFEPGMQIKIIDAMIHFFTDTEEYEKCAKLVKVKDKIKLDFLLKSKLTGESVSVRSGSAKTK